MPTTFAALVTTVQAPPAWLKNTARIAFLLLFLTGAVWAGDSWLTLRGVHGL